MQIQQPARPQGNARINFHGYGKGFLNMADSINDHRGRKAIRAHSEGKQDWEQTLDVLLERSPHRAEAFLAVYNAKEKKQIESIRRMSAVHGTTMKAIREIPDGPERQKAYTERRAVAERVGMGEVFDGFYVPDANGVVDLSDERLALLQTELAWMEKFAGKGDLSEAEIIEIRNRHNKKRDATRHNYAIIEALLKQWIRDGNSESTFRYQGKTLQELQSARDDVAGDNGVVGDAENEVVNDEADETAQRRLPGSALFNQHLSGGSGTSVAQPTSGLAPGQAASSDVISGRQDEIVRQRALKSVLSIFGMERGSFMGAVPFPKKIKIDKKHAMKAAGPAWDNMDAQGRIAFTRAMQAMLDKELAKLKGGDNSSVASNSAEHESIINSEPDDAAA